MIGTARSINRMRTGDGGRAGAACAGGNAAVPFIINERSTGSVMGTTGCDR